MKKRIVIIMAILGAIAGIAVVRYFFLSSIQIIGWNIFWNHLGNFNFNNADMVFRSDTFMKCLIGLAIGAVSGIFAGYQLKK